MEVATVLSGSSGNCVYVASGRTRVLVDAGASGKKIVQALEDIQVDAREIDAILVTHEHIDHIRGLGILSRRYKIPVYASPKTWQELDCIGDVAEENRREFTYGQEIGDLKVEFFKISHDAVQPVGMAFYHGGEHVGVATDTGRVTQGMRKYLTGADAIVFEANHDETMLREGPYPYHLKKRIAGDQGHLANSAAGEALQEIISGRTKDVILAHLSDVNNTPDKAHNAVAEVFRAAGIDQQVKLTVAPRYQAHQIVSIKRM